MLILWGDQRDLPIGVNRSVPKGAGSHGRVSLAPPQPLASCLAVCPLTHTLPCDTITTGALPELSREYSGIVLNFQRGEINKSPL